MTFDKASRLLSVQAGFGGFYNRDTAKQLPAEARCEHGQAAIDQHIHKLGWERLH